MGVILVAYERESEQVALEKLLSPRGHRVIKATNGLEALEAARREPPHAIVADIVLPRIESVRVVDMSGSNAWAEFAGVFARNRAAYLEHEQAKIELKSLMPVDAKEAIGHGVWAKRSKSGAVSFDLLAQEGTHAAVE